MAGSDQQEQQDVSGNTGQRASHRCGRRWGVKRSGLWMMLLLALASLLFMAGCGGDDDGDTERVDLNEVLVADTLSVFRVLENRTFRFAPSGGGLFYGLQNAELEFGPVMLDENGVPRAPYFVRDLDTIDPATGSAAEGEGDSDGGASCNFTITVPNDLIPGAIVGETVRCGKCEYRVSGLGIPLGGEGNAVLSWDLAVNETDPPLFTSVEFPVVAGVDDAGNLVTVNGVPVEAEPVP